MNRLTPTLLLSALAVLLTGCGGESSGQSDAEGATTRPASFLLDSEPSGATSVQEAKLSAREGETVVVRGRIGGRMTPISSDSPVFTIVDLEVPYCGQENETDQCPTPWDYCCETPETLRAAAATVQLVDESGGPLEVDPLGEGLGALDEVVVIGTVGPRPSEDVFTIRATGVHRAGG